MNSRQLRAARIDAPDILCLFVMSDLLDIDQSLTSATIRADASAITLRERTQPSDATIRNLLFATNTGSIEQFTGMYRVTVEDGSTPTGTFQIELFNPSELTVVDFDIVSLPSDPGIQVFASADGVTQVAASAISRSRYRVNACSDASSYTDYAQVTQRVRSVVETMTESVCTWCSAAFPNSHSRASSIYPPPGTKLFGTTRASSRLAFHRLRYPPPSAPRMLRKFDTIESRLV